MSHFSKDTELSGLVGKPGRVEDCLVSVPAPWCRVRLVHEGGHLLQVAVRYECVSKAVLT